jgi:hypothetical protein
MRMLDVISNYGDYFLLKSVSKKKIGSKITFAQSLNLNKLLS